jgi:hypothetical protein
VSALLEQQSDISGQNPLTIGRERAMMAVEIVIARYCTMTLRVIV